MYWSRACARKSMRVLNRSSSIRCAASAMSLKRLKEITHTTSVRLTLWYTFLFTAGALLLFGLSFLQFRAGVMQLVRELIRVHAESYAAAYRQGGEKALRQVFE